MAEMGNQWEPSGETGAAATASDGLSAPAPTLLQAPAAGEVMAVAPRAGGVYLLDPAAYQLGLEMAWRGDDLVLAFSGAGSIEILGAAAFAEAELPPRLVLPDGSELGLDRLYALRTAAEAPPPLETVAGPEAGAGSALPGGGVHGYDDDTGAVTVAGLTGAGALGAVGRSDPLSFDVPDSAEVAGAGAAGSATGPAVEPDGPGGGGVLDAEDDPDDEDEDAEDEDDEDEGGPDEEDGPDGGEGGDDVSDAEDDPDEEDGPDGGEGGDDVPDAEDDPDDEDEDEDDDDEEDEGGLDEDEGDQDNDDGPGLNDDDVITGGDGADRLVGGANDDTLDGGAGDDRLNGGSGDDILIGGEGDDLLQGGAGADVFLFDFGNGQTAPGDDVVRDFDAGDGDVLRFTAVLDDDFEAAVESIEDDGRDIVIAFKGGGSLTLDGLGTGAIETVNALLDEIGQASVEVA